MIKASQGAVRRDERVVAAISLQMGPDHAMASELAAAAELSPARFSHPFVQTTGMLPSEFIRLVKQYRVELSRAVQLLEAIEKQQ